MTTRYQKSQIEDVARILRRRYYPLHSKALVVWQGLVDEFADLFAADNPPTCIVSILSAPIAHERHDCVLEGGFARERFLAACGLESEG
ncbi:hypothetical protein LCGC14_1393810 [marine sediment metagenome]|uniref:Uncharacterized protein n=1 Tax=marine sediment metagenome TaxID=412755 RepID=A0A0F9JZ50_9ZZZZ